MLSGRRSRGLRRGGRYSGPWRRIVSDVRLQLAKSPGGLKFLSFNAAFPNLKGGI